MTSLPDMQGLDPKALEAASQSVIAEWKSICSELDCSPGDVARDFVSPANHRLLKAAITAYLAYLPQQTAEPVAWRFKSSDPNYDDAYVYCATEKMALLRCPKNSGVEPLYAHPASPPVGGALGELLTRVDTQVLTAASEMNAEQRAQPEWLWHVDQEAVTVTYGRWAKLNTQAPYIRADLVLSALASSERSGREAAIYIASKTKHAARWRALRDSGVPINSTWIDEAGEGESQDLQDLWRRCLSEASNASAIIVYREPNDVLKGAWIELGAAASHGVPVFAVGIEEFTIARHKGIQHFDNFDDALAAAIRKLSEVSHEH